MKGLIFTVLLLVSLALSAFCTERYGDVSRWGQKGVVGRWGYADSSAGAEAAWPYRVPLIVVNDGAERTHYVVRFNLSSNDSVTAHAKSDGSDLRCQNEHGQSLYHWWRSDTNWVIDVKCDTIEASSTDTIGYLLYGNASASSTSNGDLTFLLFQDWDTDYVVCGQNSPAHFDTFVDYSSNPILNRADEIREFSNVFWIGDTMNILCPAYSGSYQGDRDTMITHLAKSANGTTWVWVDSILGTETDSHWVEDWYVVTDGCELSVNKNTPYTSGDTMFAVGEGKGPDPLWSMCLYYSLDSFETMVYAGAVMSPEGDEDLIASPVCWWSADSNKFFLFYEASVSGVLAGGCLATASSLYGTWTRNANNPVLELGGNGTWDDVTIVVHDGWWDNGLFYLWYHAMDGADVNRF